MVHTDTIDFIGYSLRQPSICADGTIRRLTQQYIAGGYELTKGLPYPFDSPNNKLTTSDEIEQAIQHACNFAQRRRTLTFWRYPLAFSLRFAQPQTGLIEWTIFVQTDTFVGPDNNLGEQNAVELVQVLKAALAMMPTEYGCLYTLQSPPSIDDVMNGTISTMYPITYFGERFLGVVDREKLANLPAWLNEAVGSGQLVVPSIKAIYADDDQAVQEAARYLFGNGG